MMRSEARSSVVNSMAPDEQLKNKFSTEPHSLDRRELATDARDKAKTTRSRTPSVREFLCETNFAFHFKSTYTIYTSPQNFLGTALLKG